MRLFGRKTAMLSNSQVAWLLDTDTTTINRWVKAGIMKPYRTSSHGEPVFKREDVTCLLTKFDAVNSLFRSLD